MTWDVEAPLLLTVRSRPDTAGRRQNGGRQWTAARPGRYGHVDRTGNRRLCGFTSTNLGVTTHYANEGTAAAGPFVIDVNGTQTILGGLTAGATGSVWSMPYVYPGANVAFIDSTSQVAESDEGNNQLSQGVPIPTLPLTCTPTPTPTTPSAPAASATSTASSSAATAGATPTSGVAALPDVGGGASSAGAPGWLLASFAIVALLSLSLAGAVRLRKGPGA